MFLLWLRQLPWCWDRTLASVLPPTEGRSSPSNTPVFPPSSFLLPSFAWFYKFFPLVRYSCLLSAVLCMHFCVWRCIPDVSMERCTPRPPTPPPSCSLLTFFFFFLMSMYVLQRTESPECRPWILLDQVSVWDVLPFTNHSHGHCYFFHFIKKKLEGVLPAFS